MNRNHRRISRRCFIQGTAAAAVPVIVPQSVFGGANKTPPSERIAVGFIGAYSTFSTYEWETLSTLRSGAFVLAALYAGGSLILGLAAVWAGSMLGEVL